jgi:hypothetical protein
MSELCAARGLWSSQLNTIERRDFNAGWGERTSGKTYSGTAAAASGRVGKVDHESYAFS